MTKEQLLTLEKYLPRNIDYFADTYLGLPVLEGVAHNEDVIYYCPRCQQIHFADRMALAGRLYKQIEPCDKDNIGDVFIKYFYEVKGLADRTLHRFRLLVPRDNDQLRHG